MTLLGNNKTVETVSTVVFVLVYYPADLTVSKRPGNSYGIEIHFAVFNRLYLLLFFIKPGNQCLLKKIISQPEV